MDLNIFFDQCQKEVNTFALGPYDDLHSVFECEHCFKKVRNTFCSYVMSHSCHI